MIRTSIGITLFLFQFYNKCILLLSGFGFQDLLIFYSTVLCGSTLARALVGYLLLFSVCSLNSPLSMLLALVCWLIVIKLFMFPFFFHHFFSKKFHSENRNSFRKLIIAWIKKFSSIKHSKSGKAFNFILSSIFLQPKHKLITLLHGLLSSKGSKIVINFLITDNIRK